MGRLSWHQLQVEERFHVHPEGPAVRLGELCAGCGRPLEAHHEDLLEGSHSYTRAMSIARHQPLTITLPEFQGGSVAVSDLTYGSFTTLPSELPHSVGESLKAEQHHVEMLYPQRAAVVSIEAARRLADVGISGIAFQPVHIA
jgi:hypothetical protein